MGTRTGDPTKFTMANGIRLTLRDASPMLVISIRKQADADEPKPPIITREDREGRQEPNEDDPVYRAAHAKWALGIGTRAINVLAAACVTVDEVPDGIPEYDSTAWATQVEVVYGLQLEENPTLRMVQWLFLQTTADDLAALGPVLLARAGAEEGEVQRALDSFRGFAQRPADPAGATNGSRGNGDTVTAPAARNRAARRRAASR